MDYVKKLHEKLHARAGRSGKLDKLKGLEEQFVHSWNWVEDLYRSHPCYNEVVSFMNEMRTKGYHKYLRAGQSMWTLMLSRALHHGLSKKHTYVYFCFSKDEMVAGLCGETKKEITFPQIKLTPEIESWLDQLRYEMIT
ncbi:hypothetical protein [Candidatus Uabimicrobium sp. HlEnr_7]|uniref:hypothetical protein n=1 Tax=Candidatus Uabimicrobium helgolandensis TaxID=3095367 RepID=UPI0035567C52